MDDQLIQFDRGSTVKTHDIIIRDDNKCEKDINETFFSNMEVFGDSSFINVSVPETAITIDDSNEGECGKPLLAIFPARDFLLKYLDKGTTTFFMCVTIEYTSNHKSSEL